MITVGSPRVGRSWWALLVAFGIDNFGSGLFLPLTVVFVTRVVGLPLAQAGAAITAGTAAGLVVPAVGGRLVERFGARAVVIAAQLVQAAGAGLYLLARGATSVVAASVLVAAGQQLFYSSLFMFIAQIVGPGPKDRPFTLVSTVRAGAFSAGAVAAGVLLSTAGPREYRWGLVADVITFVLAATVLALGTRATAATPTSADPAGARLTVPRDGRYLLLIAVAALFALALDFFLIGMPVFVLNVLAGPTWLPGALLAVLDVAGCAALPIALRWTGSWSRPRSLRLAAVATMAWCGSGAAAVLVPPAGRAGYLLAGVLLAANLPPPASGKGAH